MIFESWPDIAENKSSRPSFDTSAFVMSNNVRNRSRSRTAACLARKDSTATANSLAMRSRNAISAVVGSSGATELKPNAPNRLSPTVRGTSTRVLIPSSRATRTPSGQRVSDSRSEITSGCWFCHTQPAGSSPTGSRRLVMTGLPGSFKMYPCMTFPLASWRISPR